MTLETFLLFHQTSRMMRISLSTVCNDGGGDYCVVDDKTAAVIVQNPDVFGRVRVCCNNI